MSNEPITGAYNDAVIAEAYEAYRRDPSSVDESWRQFFRFAESIAGAPSATPGGAPSPAGEIDPAFLRRIAAAAELVDAIRSYGHMAVPLDPLGTEPEGTPELTPEFHGLTEEDLHRIPGIALGAAGGTAADVVTRLRELYSSRIGFEISHVGKAEEREWLREEIESGRISQPLTADEKKRILELLTRVDGLERFLGRAYQGYKRFSIEGTDVLVPMLDVAIESAAEHGGREVAVAMAHRGRINVLTHTIGKPYATIFEEFEGKHAATNAVSETGDVKYHLGAVGTRTTASGKQMDVLLIPNPSHLEMVNPVLEGVARARQVMARDETRETAGSAGERDAGDVERNELAVVPICVHGDAAFPGEGVVAETFNLSGLKGYTTGGTLHIIVNNQLGFTTDPIDARSTHYASDLAKGFEVPIVHVNADDAESCVRVVQLGIVYRAKFRKDFLIDLVGYRRHGHNETDEPAFTQPMLYKKIKSHPSPREVWGNRLVGEGIVTADDVKKMDDDAAAEFDRILTAMKAGELHTPEHNPAKTAEADQSGAGSGDTAVAADRLRSLNEQLLKWPSNLKVNPRLAKTLMRRAEAMGDAGGIDWGHAEALAFGSLLTDGKSIRLTGQDSERATFSHRQAVLHDSETGETYFPLQNLAAGDGNGRIEIYNSPLSEMGVLGFEYGYSTAAEDTLVLWEAQYGDFVNVAQPMIDQFISADRAKWGQDSSIVLLLPHGYEGQGPEHSSARLERFLQLCAEGNQRVAYPSTPAQYFHILRRQAQLYERRPLVLMQPKSLLRLPEAASKLTDLTSGSFRPVIDDPVASQNREAVTRLVFCTGKIYYDIIAKRAPFIAVVRVEELYPWPGNQIAQIVDLYPAIEEVVWAQEEPKNQGAWSYVSPRLRMSTGNALLTRYVGRPDRASPAEGYAESHKKEQERIIAEVNAPMPQLAGAKGRRGMTVKT
ncbi:MAG TPA: 2-oxoglutarate dehydrogenase E1 component [Gemmatimonadaceae bacterium]|nr:2-oxoglutarate dehydrogenase E1 component [Gemmatimonadaceae bacterium]